VIIVVEEATGYNPPPLQLQKDGPLGYFPLSISSDLVEDQPPWFEPLLEWRRGF